MRERFGARGLELTDAKRGAAERWREQEVVLLVEAVNAPGVRLQDVQAREGVASRELGTEHAREPRRDLELVARRSPSDLGLGEVDASGDGAANDGKEGPPERLRVDVGARFLHLVTEGLAEGDGVEEGGFAIGVHRSG